MAKDSAVYKEEYNSDSEKLDNSDDEYDSDNEDEVIPAKTKLNSSQCGSVPTQAVEIVPIAESTDNHSICPRCMTTHGCMNHRRTIAVMQIALSGTNRIIKSRTNPTWKNLRVRDKRRRMRNMRCQLRKKELQQRPRRLRNSYDYRRFLFLRQITMRIKIEQRLRSWCSICNK